MRGPLRGPGSEGSEGSACLWQAGSEGGGIAIGHACGVRVQRVQKVPPALGRRVQRVVVSPFRGDEHEVCVTGFPAGHGHPDPRRRISVRIVSEGKPMNTREGTAAFLDRAAKIRQLPQSSLPDF